MPAQILAVYLGVVDRNILGIPKGIFRIDDSTAYLYIATILERIVSLLTIILNVYILAVHER